MGSYREVRGVPDVCPIDRQQLNDVNDMCGLPRRG